VNTTQIVLAGEPVASMTLAAQRACAVPELPLAIIGGFAVTCRLGHVHRATGDVDAVADELATIGAEGSSAQALVERGIAQPDPGGRDHRVFVDGTKLEIIDTQALYGDNTVPPPDWPGSELQQRVLELTFGGHGEPPEWDMPQTVPTDGGLRDINRARELPIAVRNLDPEMLE
jgi:hypothetical protein